MWWDEFNSVFWTGIATMSFGALALLIRYFFASKCDNVSICFGMVRIHRVVELEEQKEDDLEEQHHGKEENKSDVYANSS